MSRKSFLEKGCLKTGLEGQGVWAHGDGEGRSPVPSKKSRCFGETDSGRFEF